MGVPIEPTPSDRTQAAAALARLWWLSAARGLVALMLALAVVIAGRDTARLVTFLGLYWMVGGLITVRFALAIRPRAGTRLALVAGIAAVVGAVIVLLRDLLRGLVAADLLVGLLGVSAVLTGLLVCWAASPPKGNSAAGGRSVGWCSEHWRSC